MKKNTVYIFVNSLYFYYFAVFDLNIQILKFFHIFSFLGKLNNNKKIIVTIEIDNR